MKNIIVMMLLLCISFNTIASTGTVSALEKHIDEFQYTLTVEWDQKDQQFYEKATKNFYAQMENLINQGHLTKAEVLTLVEKKFIDKNALEALKLKFTLLDKVDSPQELIKLVKESSDGLYSKGASWNGEVLIPLAIGIVILAVLAYKWWWDYNHKCIAWEERFDCSSSSWDDRSCWDITDDEGDVIGQDCDYFWNMEVTTTCGPMNFCTQYEKIDHSK